MIRLIEPCEAYLASYTEAFDEYEGYPRVAGNPLTNPHTTDLLAKYERYHHERDLPANRVGATYFWLVNEEAHLFLGECRSYGVYSLFGRKVCRYYFSLYSELVAKSYHIPGSSCDKPKLVDRAFFLHLTGKLSSDAARCAGNYCN